jgi:hypothetical protein
MMSDEKNECPKCGTTELEGEQWSHCTKCCAKVGIGVWPVEMCKGNQSDHGPMGGFDDAFEPYVDCQLLTNKDPRCNSTDALGRRGVMINSRSERRALMKEQGLQYGTQKFNERGKKLYFTT